MCEFVAAHVSSRFPGVRRLNGLPAGLSEECGRVVSPTAAQQEAVTSINIIHVFCRVSAGSARSAAASGSISHTSALGRWDGQLSHRRCQSSPLVGEERLPRRRPLPSRLCCAAGQGDVSAEPPQADVSAATATALLLAHFRACQSRECRWSAVACRLREALQVASGQ